MEHEPELHKFDKHEGVEDNIAKWQSENNPLAPLSEDQLDVIYELKDLIEVNYFFKPEVSEPKIGLGRIRETCKFQKRNAIEDRGLAAAEAPASQCSVPPINTTGEFIKWMVHGEQKSLQHNRNVLLSGFEKLDVQSSQCTQLEKTVSSVGL